MKITIFVDIDISDMVGKSCEDCWVTIVYIMSWFQLCIHWRVGYTEYPSIEECTILEECVAHNVWHSLSEFHSSSDWHIRTWNLVNYDLL